MRDAKESSKPMRQKFTHEEDALLVNLVKMHGTHARKKIASLMKTRSTRQCRERYINYLAPDLVNGPWSSEEDQQLIERAREIGPRWCKVAKYFPSRSDVNVKNRYAFLVSKGRAPILKMKKEIGEVKAELKNESSDAITNFDKVLESFSNDEAQLWGFNDFSTDSSIDDSIIGEFDRF